MAQEEGANVNMILLNNDFETIAKNLENFDVINQSELIDSINEVSYFCTVHIVFNVVIFLVDYVNTLGLQLVLRCLLKKF